jgi:uncharacterized repeat protein (TIGR01451 family)
MYKYLLSLAAISMLAAGASGAAAAPATAAVPEPAWSIKSFGQPTSFSPSDGARDAYIVVVRNVGTLPTSGAITVTDTLPPGTTTMAAAPSGGGNATMSWQCSEAGGLSVVTCTTEGSVPALTAAAALEIPVAVVATQGTLTNRIEVAGGGAVATTAETSTQIASPPQTFEPLEFAAEALGPAGMLETRAGAHPASLDASFVFPSVIRAEGGHTIGKYTVEDVKQIVTDLPAGLVGDAQATPTCSLSDLSNFGACAPDTRVGTLALTESATQSTNTELTIFNVTPEHGFPAEFGAFLPSLGRAGLLYATVVGSGPDTHVRVISAPQNRSALHVNAISLSFFGNPSLLDGAVNTPLAFATDPSNCAASSFTTSIYVDSWQNPGRVGPDGQPDLSDPNWKKATSTSPPVTGCEVLQFHPTLSFAPESAHSQADEPSGYESIVRLPQNEDPAGLATPPLKTTVVTLPAGVAISPSAANGLVGCQEVGAEGIELQSPDHGRCPAASTVGNVELTTPLLNEVLKGSVFVAQPTCGGVGQSECTEEAAETGGLFALYLEVGSENTGVHLKLKGKVEVGGAGHHNDLAPGQVRTTFAETPQDPFSELKLNFNAGPRAPLANPQSCGSFTSVAQLEPWSHQPAPGEAQGTPDVTLNPSFSIAGCENKFAPGFVAGTVNSQAAGYTPFTLTFSRQDREQDLAGVTVSMPQGLLGRIAGIAQCPDSQASAGSCAAASRVGTVTAAAGAGSHPFWQSGAVYLTGPYRGAPFGLSVVVPAVAGPFNLGNIVVRAAIYINPATAQVTVVSDPLPQSVDGVPLRVKTVNVTVDREAFIFNPTNCVEQRVGATVASAQGVSAVVSSRFQAANCASLPFKPSFTASTAGRTSKANGASLTVKVSERPGEANIHKVDLTLPLALPARLTTLQKACTEAQFNANPAGCPEASVIGMATARTPVLNVPLVGPAYLVSHGGAAFPDVEFILQGEGVEVVLDGGTDIKKGITYSRFETVPDAPISSFETVLPEGPHSVLATNIPASARGSLCGRSLVIPTSITGQNGAVVSQSTKVAVTGCAKVKAKALTRAQKLAKALKACRKDRRGKKRAGCEKTARKRYGVQGKRKAKAKR